MINKKKIIATTGLSLFVFALAATQSLAFTRVSVSGNGSDSDNNVRINSSQRMSFSQRNNADFNNRISVNSETGNNNAGRNNGGDTSIETGDSRVNVEVSNQANMNVLNSGCSDCGEDGNGNGGSNGNGNGSGNGGNNGNGSSNDHSWKKLNASLNGAQEVPGPGDPNGWGYAKVAVIPSMGKLCIAMQVGNIEPATAAHIHESPAGVSGPVVITLPTPDSNGYVKGCVDADMNELMEIKNNPSNYYVNVHNTPYPNGAVRGQLSH